MISNHAIAFIKKHEAETDREERKAMIRKEYEKICTDGDALIATMENVGMSTEEIYLTFEKGAMAGIKAMFERTG